MMQNRYAGDIGDFSKLGLLRELSKCGMKIGINWYLTPKENNTDGLYTNYLEKREYRECDEELCRALSKVVALDENRSVAALEAQALLPVADTRYFSKELNFSGKPRQERASIREDWHRKALETLRGCDIVFVDPDNGLVVPSAENTVKNNKYVLPCELNDYYASGASVIYYQHKARMKDPIYIEKHIQLLACGKFPNAEGMVLKFTKTSQRFYFMIVQPQHRDAFAACMKHMQEKPWGEHFVSKPLEAHCW